MEIGAGALLYRELSVSRRESGGLLAEAARAEIAPMVLAWLFGELRLSLRMREATLPQKQVENFNFQIMEIESYGVETLKTKLGIQRM